MSTFITVVVVVGLIVAGLAALRAYNKRKKASSIQAQAYTSPVERAQADLAAYRKVQEPVRPYATGGKVLPSKAAPKPSPRPKSKSSSSESYYAGSDYSYFDEPSTYSTRDDSSYGGGQSSGSGSSSSYDSGSSSSYDSGSSSSSSSDSSSSSSSD